MALPTVYDLQLYEGDDTIWVFQHTDDQGKPTNISGCVIRLALKKYFAEPEPMLIAYAQLYNPALGKFAIAIPSNTTSGITGGQFLSLVHDIQLTMPNGFVKTWLRGIFSINPEVAK